jgi:acylpyruvate hydrolase
MRIGTARLNGGTRAVRVDGDRATILAESGLAALLAHGADWRDRARAVGEGELAVAEVDFAPLVPNPEKIVCVGLNYRSHAAEANLEVPDHPTLFAKYARALIGARDDIAMPAVSEKVDWEAELALVIGTSIRNASEAEALEAIAGYTVLNDISMRDWQRRTSQFLQGKTFERTTPVGPWLTTGDEVDDARDLRMTCEVDGETMQQTTTADMVFSPAEIVAYVSRIITLVPGDLIATGTGPGVGGARKPPRFLSPGNVVVTRIEGLGELENRCVADAERGGA